MCQENFIFDRDELREIIEQYLKDTSDIHDYDSIDKLKFLTDEDNKTIVLVTIKDC